MVSLCLSLLIGCSSKDLSEDFDEEEVKNAAENVIELINNKDMDGLLDICTVSMKEGLTEEVLDKVYEGISEGGKFKGVDSMSIAGMTDKKSEEELAIVVAKAKYEIKTFAFTITFTKQMKLAGLYYR